jgi:hypothetical protein
VRNKRTGQLGVQAREDLGGRVAQEAAVRRHTLVSHAASERANTLHGCNGLLPSAARRRGRPHRRRLCSRNSAPSFVKRLSSSTPAARSLLEIRTSGDDSSWRPHCAAHIVHAPPMHKMMGYA